MFLTELINTLYHPCIHLGCHSGIYANPEGVGHHEVGILKISYLTIALATLAHLIEYGMLDEVASKEIAGLNLIVFKIACEFIASKTCIFLDSYEETKPRRV